MVWLGASGLARSLALCWWPRSVSVSPAAAADAAASVSVRQKIMRRLLARSAERSREEGLALFASPSLGTWGESRLLARSLAALICALTQIACDASTTAELVRSLGPPVRPEHATTHAHLLGGRREERALVRSLARSMRRLCLDLKVSFFGCNLGAKRESTKIGDDTRSKDRTHYYGATSSR